MRKHFAVVAGVALALAAPWTLAAGERSDRPAHRTALTKPAAKPAGITAEQRELLNEKIAHARRLMEAATDGREVTADYRIWLLESMYAMPLAQLRAIQSQGHEATVKAIVKAAKTPAKLGQASTELVYYPITPCRYIDTRSVGGPLNVSRQFDLANTGNVYGGVMACNPKSAVGGNEDNIGALAMNVAIVSPTVAPGFVGVRPAGSTASTALVNWYIAGPTVQASNAGVVTTDQTVAANEIEVFGGATQFIVDVFGVFAAPTATALDCVNGTETNTTIGTGARNFNLFASACPTGYTMVSNSCQTTAPSTDIVLGGSGVFSGPDSNCFGYYSGASAAETVFNAPWCCRVPGR
jgi:hypothetical protein